MKDLKKKFTDCTIEKTEIITGGGCSDVSNDNHDGWSPVDGILEY